MTKKILIYQTITFWVTFKVQVTFRIRKKKGINYKKGELTETSYVAILTQTGKLKKVQKQTQTFSFPGPLKYCIIISHLETR